MKLKHTDVWKALDKMAAKHGLSASGAPKGWCDTCQNTGYVECLCGGDLCICENNGEMECPDCNGMPDDDEDYDDPA